jgi:3-oxoacyl-[acyl-carrier-protein] synthase II
MSPRRVAITGLGVVTPLGNSVEELLASLLAGRSGVGRLPAELGTGLRSPIAATVKFDGGAFFPAPRLRMLDRVSQFALVAAAAAVADARLNFSVQDRERCGVCIGTSGLSHPLCRALRPDPAV